MLQLISETEIVNRSSGTRFRWNGIELEIILSDGTTSYLEGAEAAYQVWQILRAVISFSSEDEVVAI